MNLLQLPDDLLAQIVDLEPWRLRACSRKLKNLADGSAQRVLRWASNEVAPLPATWLSLFENFQLELEEFKQQIDNGTNVDPVDKLMDVCRHWTEFSNSACHAQDTFISILDKFAWHPELRCFICSYAVYLQWVIETAMKWQERQSLDLRLTLDFFNRVVRLSMPLLRQAPWYTNDYGQPLDFQKTEPILVCELVLAVLDNEYTLQNYTWPQPPEAEQWSRFLYRKVYCESAERV